VNTAAGQKASTDINSESHTTSFNTNVQPSAGVATPAFGSFGTDTTAHTFAASSANAFPGPVNLFSSPAFAQSSTVPQQGAVATGFGGSASFTSSSHPQTFGSAQPAGANSGQSHTTDAASLVYTPLDKLSAEDRAQYEAPKFTLGHVPVRPPPKELI